ncbi:aldehyde dehydrogenase, partial [Mycobacterium sp. ITM-2017-0098]
MDTGETVGLLVGGDRITASSAGIHHHVYPVTGRPNAVVALAGPSEVAAAVRAGGEAQREWVSLTVDVRRDRLIGLADVIHQHLDELARLNVSDYAVPISFAGTAVLLERFLRHFAGYVDKPHGVSTPVNGSFDINLIERQPYGVVGIIAPWNGA